MIATEGFMRLLAAVVALTIAPTGAAAQGPVLDPAPRRVQELPGRPDFLFGRPRGSVALRGSRVFARAGSDLFDFVQDQFTVESDAFNAPSIAADLAIAVHPRVDAVVGFEYSRAEMGSEYRGFVDNERLPITQTTTLDEMNVSGGVKVAVTPRGREIGRLAWVPRMATPFVGAGAGALRYSFTQTGDFVDFVDLSVFPATFRTQGWAPSAHVLAGVDVKLFRRWFFTAEGRYLWAAGELSRDFEGFDPIDLAGFRVGAGINVLF